MSLKKGALQPRANHCNARCITRNGQTGGSSPLVGSSEVAATATINLHGANRGIGAAGPKTAPCLRRDLSVRFRVTPRQVCTYLEGEPTPYSCQVTPRSVPSLCRCFRRILNDVVDPRNESDIASVAGRRL